MSEHKKDDKAVAEPTPKRGGGFMGKLVIALFMASVIVGECVFAYVMFPDPKELARIAQEITLKQMEKGKSKHEDGAEEEDTDAKIKEVELGTFDITAFQAAANSHIRISFKLFGTLKESDESAFEALKTENENRLRDKIIYEIRNAAIEDLTDPALGLIKRRILDKSNALFGKTILKAVVFSNFACVEQ